MILHGEALSSAAVSSSEYDLCLYGLGFETRSPFVAGLLNSRRTIALQMPRIDLHAFERNVAFAKTRKHHIISDFYSYLDNELSSHFARSTSLTIAFDISSLNRVMMLAILTRLARLVRPSDKLEIYYCPAAYAPPDWRFPQIEKLGPVSHDFTAYDARPDLPLCLVMGLGFEPGVSMGIISQLEPRMSYCFWGSGIDRRFDRDVKRANFDFGFPGFTTRSVSFPMENPQSSYLLLESLTAGLLDRYNIIFVPMGPKLFSFLAGLVGLTYRGKVAVWRVQQRRSLPPDARPGEKLIVAQLDTRILSGLASGMSLEAA